MPTAQTMDRFRRTGRTTRMLQEALMHFAPMDDAKIIHDELILTFHPTLVVMPSANEARLARYRFLDLAQAAGGLALIRSMPPDALVFEGIGSIRPRVDFVRWKCYDHPNHRMFIDHGALEAELSGHLVDALFRYLPTTPTNTPTSTPTTRSFARPRPRKLIR